MKEEVILAALEAGYRAPKRILGALDWKVDANQSRILRIPLACDCGSPDITGLSIIGTAYVAEPNQRVTFQMCMDLRGTDYRIARIDWRPRQPHTNRYGPTRGLTLYTSIHDFLENAALGVRIMQTENLPIVKPIEPEPPDFPALATYLRDTFRLDNAQNMPVPPWSPLLV